MKINFDRKKAWQKRLPKEVAGKRKKKSNKTRLINRIVFQNGVNNSCDFLLNVTENDVIVFAFRLLFSIVRRKNRIVLPNDA